MFDAELNQRAERLIAFAIEQHMTVATAESCTGGLLAGLLTQVPGSSAVVERGFITYSNAAKMQMLGVPPTLIEHHGAVSANVAQAMVAGVLAHSPADIAVSITGIAGPGGGTPAKPVGLVYLACASRGGAVALSKQQFGDRGREGVRHAALLVALDMLDDALHAARP